MKPEIAVLIPCYNEEETIGKVVRDFKLALPEALIYVYDNNSEDKTSELAASAGAIVRKELKQGKGNVVRSMFRDIDADVYLMVDGDDTYPASSARIMVEKILEGYDMVVGDRLSSTYFRENKRAFHGIGNKFVRGSINLIFRSHIHDVMTGYRAMSFTFVKTYPALYSGFEIETEMTMHALDKKCRIFEMPIEFHDRVRGSVSKLNTVSDGFKIIKSLYSMCAHFRPLLFFGIFSLMFFFAGFGLLVWIFFLYWETGMVLKLPTLIGSGFLILCAAFSFISGIILDTQAKNAREKYICDCNSFDLQRKLQKGMGKK